MAATRGGDETALQDEDADPAFFRSQLKAPASTIGERLDLPHNGGKARLAQPLLQSPEPLGLVRCASEEKTLRVKALRGQARPVEIAKRGNPEHRTVTYLEQPGQDRQAEAGDRTVIPVAAQPLDLVQSPQRQATAR